MGQPSFQTGCQRVLVPVQEPPARTCWPPALAAPARTVASAGSRKTTRASPAVAHPAGKVRAWPVWGFSTPRTSQLLRERKMERREGGQGPAAGRWLPACPAQFLALGRVLTCPTAQQGGWDAAITHTPWRGQFAARARTRVGAVPKTSSSSPGAFANTSSPRGLCPPGQTCEIDINECVKSPCRNGATCQNTNGSYRCACRTGFTGRNCDTDIDDCKPSKSRGCSVDHAQPGPEPSASLPFLGLGFSFPCMGEPWPLLWLGPCCEPCPGFWATLSTSQLSCISPRPDESWQEGGWGERGMGGQ